MAHITDFVICLGGDGVILHASWLFPGGCPPVVSLHLGSLGFLTNHNFEYYRSVLRGVLYGQRRLKGCDQEIEGKVQEGVLITLRMRLQCEIYSKGKLVRTVQVGSGVGQGDDSVSIQRS